MSEPVGRIVRVQTVERSSLMSPVINLTIIAGFVNEHEQVVELDYYQGQLLPRGSPEDDPNGVRVKAGKDSDNLKAHIEQLGFQVRGGMYAP